MGGALDFAGGTVVHISSGISALVGGDPDWPSDGILEGTHSASQLDLHGARRGDAVGRLVRFQRRQ